MKTQEFCYWLQGFFEISDSKSLTDMQVQIIKNHLNLVFVHDIDPQAGDQSKQDILNKIHNSGIFSPESEGEPQGGSSSGPDGHTLFRC